jgi:hypothetical protein
VWVGVGAKARFPDPIRAQPILLPLSEDGLASGGGGKMRPSRPITGSPYLSSEPAEQIFDNSRQLAKPS